MTPALLIAVPLLTLAGVTVLVTAYVMLRKKRREFEHRINLTANIQQNTAPSAPPSSIETLAGRLERGVKMLFTFGAGYSWGMKASPALLVAAALICFGLAWFATSRLGLRAWMAAPVCLALSFAGPRIVLTRQQRSAEIKFTALFPDAVDSVARMLRAGLPVAAAIRTVGKEAPPPVCDVFHTVSDKLKIGIPLGEALDISSRQIAVPDYRYFAVSVMLQHATGGNLVTTLDVLSQTMRKRRAARLRAQSLTGEVRISAYVLGALPFVVTAALLVIQPDYLSPLFKDPRGHRILAAAGGGLLLSYFSMRSMMRRVTGG
jgi:tight adherence protein B